MLLSLSGLQSVTYTAQTAAPHTVKGNLQIPIATSDGAVSSSVVVTVVQNSTTVYTGSPGATGFKTVLEVAIGDTITVTLASTNSLDTPINAVRAVIGISVGPS